MRRLDELLKRVIARVNVSLRQHRVDVGDYVHDLIKPEQFVQFYAFYGLTSEHPLAFHFEHASLAGSYFLGKCKVRHSILYKSDIRGDELKKKGDVFGCEGLPIALHDDETINIKDSFLIKTLVHNFSHAPEHPEVFPIWNTLALHYANIHGSPSEGLFLGPFATVDLTAVNNSIVGAYAYVQVGELNNAVIPPGKVLIRSGEAFEFSYQFAKGALKKYVEVTPGEAPRGVFMNFVERRKVDFERVFGFLYASQPEISPPNSFISRYAVVKGRSHIGENVLVAQRAYLEEAWLGQGANVQENCYIIHSRLEGNDVTAHGGKIIHCRLGTKVFVGFNAFLQGSPEYKFKVGDGCIIMPHTIVDLKEPVEVPPNYVVWGLVRTEEELAKHSLPIKEFAKVRGKLRRGAMTFSGDGQKFVETFASRIDHILEANGAYFDGAKLQGHAQKTQNIMYNLIQPYSDSEWKGIYPNIRIFPVADS